MQSDFLLILHLVQNIVNVILRAILSIHLIKELNLSHYHYFRTDCIVRNFSGLKNQRLCPVSAFFKQHLHYFHNAP